MRARIAAAALAIVPLFACSSGVSNVVDTNGTSVDDAAADTIARPGSSEAADNYAASVGPRDDLVVEVADPIFQLQSYDGSDEVLIWNATQMAIQRCMEMEGFLYTVVPSEDIMGNRRIAQKVDRLDLDLAAAAGYHAERLVPSPEITRALVAYDAAGATNAQQSSLNPAFLVALEGPEGGQGCVRGAYDLMYQGRQSLGEVFNENVLPVIQDIYTRAYLTPAVERASQEWVECMSRSGLNFDSPQLARAKFVDAVVLSSEEQSTAVADSKCRTTVGLYDITMEALSQEVDRFLDDHPGLGERIAEARSADVAAAKQVLGVP